MNLVSEMIPAEPASGSLLWMHGNLDKQFFSVYRLKQNHIEFHCNEDSVGYIITFLL